MPSELFVKFKSISKEDALTMVGKGWAGLIVELYDEKPEWVHVLHVKEKLGGLRFYVSSAPSHYLSLIDEAEKSSLHICEQCGKDGKLRTNRSWVATLCDECNGRRFEMTTQEKLSKFTDLSEIHEVHIDGVFANKDELGFHLWWKGDMGLGSIRISEQIQVDTPIKIDSENMSKEFVEKVLLSLLAGADFGEYCYQPKGECRWRDTALQISKLHGEAEADAERLANEYTKTLKEIGGVYWEEPEEISPALILHKMRKGR